MLSRQIHSTRQDQIHPGKLDLVHGALLSGKRADLIRRHHHILTLHLLLPWRRRRRRRRLRRIHHLPRTRGVGIGLATRRARAHLVADRVRRRQEDVPDADGVVSAGGDEHAALDAPAEAPDAAFGVAAHALEAATGAEVPEDDGAGFVGGRDRFAMRCDRDGRHAGCVAGEEPDRATTRHVPHPDGPIAGSRDDVGGVGVPSDAVDVAIVSCKDPQGCDVVA